MRVQELLRLIMIQAKQPPERVFLVYPMEESETRLNCQGTKSESSERLWKNKA